MIELRNGEIWKAETLYAHRAILQYMGDGDKWMLLSEPEKGRFGHKVMVPITDKATGRDVLSGEEMRARLERNGWKPMQGLELAIGEAPPR